MYLQWWVALLLAQSAQLSTPHSPVELSGIVDNSKYCEGTDELAFLQLRLRLTSRNTSNEPVIVYRAPLLFDVVVGKAEIDGRVTEVDLDFSRSIAVSGLATISESWPNRAFVLLKPGETFSSSDTVAVAVALKPGIRGTAGIGQHFLQSPAVIWPYSSELAEHLREAWSKIGRLWTDPILTKPIPFKVESSPQFETCE